MRHSKKSSTKNEDKGEINDKLMARIEKIKQNRQKAVENDKKWAEMSDENDELMSRLSRLKPVERDLDFEFLANEEEIERQKDEYFEEKEKRECTELAKNCDNNEPQEPLEEFEQLNSEAKSLLLNRPRMANAKFVKTLDIYAIVMCKKLIDPNKYYNLKLNIDAMRNKLMKKRYRMK